MKQKISFSCTKQKKAQISFEFLLTYGWAIFVVLAVIGAIFYMGIFNPEKFTSKRCVFGSQLVCSDHKLFINSTSNSPTILVRLTNSMGASINITYLNVTNTEKNAFNLVSISPTISQTSQVSLQDGSSLNLAIVGTPNTGSFYRGGKSRLIFTIVFYDPISGENAVHISHGEIYDEVQ